MQSLRSCGRFELQNNVPCRRATFINVQRFVNSRVCTLQPLRASTLLDAPTTRNKPLSEASFPEAGQTCNSQLPPFGMKASKLKSWQVCTLVWGIITVLKTNLIQTPPRSYQTTFWHSSQLKLEAPETSSKAKMKTPILKADQPSEAKSSCSTHRSQLPSCIPALLCLT